MLLFLVHLMCIGWMTWFPGPGGIQRKGKAFYGTQYTGGRMGYGNEREESLGPAVRQRRTGSGRTGYLRRTALRGEKGKEEKKDLTLTQRHSVRWITKGDDGAVMTVHEVSRQTGVSIRTLQYYDRIGLFRPSQYSDAGYRLYDAGQLETLQQILLFRELEFPLGDIRQIMQSPDFDRAKALEQQIELLRLKKEHLEKLLDLAENMKKMGVAKSMDFSAFDTRKMDEYAAQAKASWGATPEYKEYEQRARDRTQEEHFALGEGIMAIFAEFGRIREGRPDSETAQALVRKLQAYITEHFYTCSEKVLSGLGQMYAAGGEMTENIDQHGGAGTAAFAAEAIRVYCGK